MHGVLVQVCVNFGGCKLDDHTNVSPDLIVFGDFDSGVNSVQQMSTFGNTLLNMAALCYHIWQLC
jgi:hypothetical protein